MKFSWEQVGVLTGLKYNKKRYELWGTIRQYQIYLRWFPNDMTFTVRLFAKSPSDKDMRGILADWNQSHSGFTFMRAWDNRITAMLTLGDEQTVEYAAAEILALAELAEEQGLIPCCGCCGAETEAKLYSLDNDGVCICDECGALVSSDVEKANRLFADHKPKLTGAVAGCIIGAVAAFALRIWLSEDLLSGWSEIIYDFFGVCISIFLVKKLGKRATKGIAVLSTALCVFAAVFGVIFQHASYFADFNREQEKNAEHIIEYCETVELGENPFELFYDRTDMTDTISWMYSLDETELSEWYDSAQIIKEHQTTFSCIRSFPKLINSNYGDKMREDFYSLLIIGIFFAVFDGFLFWRIALPVDNARHKLIALPNIGELPI